ncbi:Reverse transcriptase domain-containing protein, partial [Aphis craccivora]
MHSTCVKCQEKLKHNEDTLECSLCKDIAHFYCVGYSEQSFKKMSNNTKSRFTCTNCKTTTSKSPKSNAAEIKIGTSMVDNINELMKSVSFMSDQFDNFNNKLDNVMSELKNIKSENQKIVTENKRLSEEVDLLKSKIDEIEQNNLGISVDITEISKKTNTTIDVYEAYRINSSISKRSLIVAKLATLEMRKNLIRNVKSNKLTADKMNNGWPKENIYINERLTKLRRTLFYQTKVAATTKEYKFVWLSNGDILVRKNENSKIVRIKSSQDINNLSPNDNLESFLTGIDLFLSQINKQHINIISGDININIMKNTNISNDYLNIMARNGFIPCINNFTRVTNHSKTCIDHIFINNIDSDKINSYILRCDITDHYATILTLSNINNNESYNHNKLFSNKIDINHLNLLIQTEDWYALLNCDNVDNMVEVFNTKINEFIKYSSISKYKIYKSNKTRKLKEWITNGIVISIRNREKLSAKIRSRPFDIKLKQYYKLYRNILNKIVRQSKQIFYQNKLKHARSDSKLVWNIINEVIGKPNQIKNNINMIRNKSGITINQTTEICNELNDFFVNVGKNLEVEKLNPYKLFPYENNNIINDSIFLKPIDKGEISKLLNKIKNNNSYFENDLTNYILKNVSNSISFPLSIIFNKSLTTGIYPKTFKKCVVIPLFKSGDKLLCSNYRPISLSLTLS